MKRRLTILIVALAAPALAASTADAAVYKDRSGLGGGGIVLTIENGKLKRIKGGLPAYCERPNGDFTTPLTTHLTGAVKLDDSRFHVHVDDPNTGVEVNITGKLRGGAVKGRVRMTYLDLHPGSPSNDTLCDSGVLRYKAD